MVKELEGREMTIVPSQVGKVSADGHARNRSGSGRSKGCAKSTATPSRRAS